MKKILYFLLAATCCVVTGCRDRNWDNSGNSIYNTNGNNALTETNVISIADLKAQYSNVIFASSDVCEQFTEDVQLKGYITANDLGGNVYSEILLDDGTGSILVCINEGGLMSYLPVGQQILVSLKDLYIGGYRKQPEIGVPYTNKNNATYISRMSRYVWQKHFKYIGTVDPAYKVKIETFDKTKEGDEAYRQAHCGSLMKIEGVEFSQADGMVNFSNEEEKDPANCVERNLKGLNNIVVRTSTYAKFAANKLPQGKVNITGLFTRYNNKWQILCRTADDIEVVK